MLPETAPAANKLWNSVQVTPDGFSQMEENFSLFWGLAIQLYEATLVADQTPFDRFLGGDGTALTLEQQDGFNLFFGAGGSGTGIWLRGSKSGGGTTAPHAVPNARDPLIAALISISITGYDFINFLFVMMAISGDGAYSICRLEQIFRKSQKLPPP
ncbi:hypothetical protein [Geotalea uraniireducens]|uniref:hypothetical protein n=1 Tax=Geotalea uraniireducens TaxID=351604 RepID=UPI000318EAC3|nr:hypothetical protein [Geotalea uraniireducens]